MLKSGVDNGFEIARYDQCVLVSPGANFLTISRVRACREAAQATAPPIGILALEVGHLRGPELRLRSGGANVSDGG